MQERLSMRKIKDVLRLKYECGLSHEQIAASHHIAQSSVSKYVALAQAAGLSWPLPEGLTEQALETKLFPRAGATLFRPTNKPPPDFVRIHDELRTHKRLNLTLSLLWTEYQEQYPDGYQYSQFCRLYHAWRLQRDPPMRQSHKAGEKLFVDYSDGLFITDPNTGDRLATDLFVAVWGASTYTFAEATFTQALPSWIASHVRALTFFGCAPWLVVPDNLKSGVTRACYYEPELNRTYADWATHYGCAILPARPYRPRDKAKVENGVLVAKRWILAVLRHRTFYSLEELNRAIGELLIKLNNRLLRKIKRARRDLFEEIDRPHAKPLPAHPYEFAEWIKAGVNIDYHIEVDKHYYSVPFRYARQSVEVRLASATLEVLLKGERIAAHARSWIAYGRTTVTEHMPLAHQKHLEWSPSRLIRWAQTIGPLTAQLVEKIMADKPHPEQGYRACLGVMHLAKKYPTVRVEAAAARALAFNACSFRSMKSILTQGLDRIVSTATSSKIIVTPAHDNIRGPHYYN